MGYPRAGGDRAVTPYLLGETPVCEVPEGIMAMNAHASYAPNSMYANSTAAASLRESCHSTYLVALLVSDGSHLCQPCERKRERERERERGTAHGM